jgi:flagellar L-ring protein precursor FlgH
MKRTAILVAVLLVPGCARLGEVGRAPDFSPIEPTAQHQVLYTVPMPDIAPQRGPGDGASLWTSERTALLGDSRAARRGDILTVVIEIDDRAEISNATGRNRTGNQTMGIPKFFGLPQRIDEGQPEGASMAEAVETGSSSSFSGDGSVRRREKLTLRVAATVVDQLPNGVLRIEGQQEVRVNYELRELVVTGFVRPADISRRNEVSYDKIAGARIAYGGRGQISDVQQPRIGQQITDLVLPF